MTGALFALLFAYLWVGVLEAIERFEQPAGPEYETAEPEFVRAPRFRHVLRIVFLFPLSPSGNRSPFRVLVKVLAHAVMVYVGAWVLSLLLDRFMLAVAAVGLLVVMAGFFYVLMAATRPD